MQRAARHHEYAASRVLLMCVDPSRWSIMSDSTTIGAQPLAGHCSLRSVSNYKTNTSSSLSSLILAEHQQGLSLPSCRHGRIIEMNVYIDFTIIIVNVDRSCRAIDRAAAGQQIPSSGMHGREREEKGGT